MTNPKAVFKKAAKLETAILVATILPILLISFFNHPLGDDYWFSALTRQKGFVQAFTTIYNSVSARYSALCLMGVNPLVFGNFMLFKLVPLLYIILLTLSTFFLLYSAVDNTGRTLSIRNDLCRLSIIYTITYVAVMPGIGEGLFWTSSLVVYQFSILGFIAWLASLIRWHLRNIHSFRNFLGCSTCFVFIIGCNEIMGAIVCLINVFITFNLLLTRRKFDLLSTTLMILMIPCWYFIVSAPSFAIRYGSPSTFHSYEPLQLFVKATVYSGYHVLKCFINPFFLIGLVLSVKPLINVGKVLIFKNVSPAGDLKTFAITWIAIIVGIEFVAIALTNNHVPPLRITNIAVYFFLLGLLALGLIWAHSLSGYVRWWMHFYKLRTQILVILLVAGFSLNNNISIASRELISKKAYLYDKEMKYRYTVISNCKNDTCLVPSLKYRPKTLRYSYFDNDSHIGEYFQKVILYQE